DSAAAGVEARATQRVGHGATTAPGPTAAVAAGLAAPAARAVAVRTAPATVAAIPAATAFGRRVVAQPQGQRGPLAAHVHLPHLDPDDVPRLDDLARVGHEPVGHRRDVHEPVLVHAHVDEGAERGDVRDHALQHHPDLEVGQLLHPLGEAGGLDRGT